MKAKVKKEKKELYIFYQNPLLFVIYFSNNFPLQNEDGRIKIYRCNLFELNRWVLLIDFQ